MEFKNTDAAELMTWMDIPAEYEEDFNAWYDTEHLEERVAIPGFVWARRYRAVDNHVRKYLGLYRADSIRVFASTQYQDAIKHQSDWSKSNLERITNTFRRVMNVKWIGGAGTGSFISLIITNSPELDGDTMLTSADIARETSGILGLHGMSPDALLSTSIPREGSAQKQRTGCLVADALCQESAIRFRNRLIQEIPNTIQDGFVFSLIWELRSSDLTR